MLLAVLRRVLLNEPDQTQVPYAQPLLDAIALFEELNIGYALAGGVAAMYYGRARFTEDLDFVATSGHMEVLAANAAAMSRHHFDPSWRWELYHESGIDLEIWKDEHANAIVRRAREVELAGRKIRVAEPHDLIAMKLRAARLQDDYDISEVVRRQPINDATIESLVSPDQYQHYLQVKRRI